MQSKKHKDHYLVRIVNNKPTLLIFQAQPQPEGGAPERLDAASADKSVVFETLQQASDFIRISYPNAEVNWNV
jgi:hypothetical protein